MKRKLSLLKPVFVFATTLHVIVHPRDEVLNMAWSAPNNTCRAKREAAKRPRGQQASPRLHHAQA